jgi:hypothetical protein
MTQAHVAAQMNHPALPSWPMHLRKIRRILYLPVPAQRPAKKFGQSIFLIESRSELLLNQDKE